MIITIASNKGGVAKTTTAVAVAHGLALHSSRPTVRITDFDRQGHAAIALGLDPEPGVFNHLVSRQPLTDLIRSTGRDNLDILPGNSYTDTAQDVLSKIHDLADVPKLIRQIATTTDILVIDTRSSGYLQEQAIVVADIIISPARPEHLGVDGLHQTVCAIQQLNPVARLCLLPCCYDGRLTEHITQWNMLKQMYPDQSFKCVPLRIAVAEATAEGKTVWESKARGIEDAQEAYRYLINWTLEN